VIVACPERVRAAAGGVIDVGVTECTQALAIAPYLAGACTDARPGPTGTGSVFVSGVGLGPMAKPGASTRWLAAATIRGVPMIGATATRTPWTPWTPWTPSRVMPTSSASPALSRYEAGGAAAPRAPRRGATSGQASHGWDLHRAGCPPPRRGAGVRRCRGWFHQALPGPRSASRAGPGRSSTRARPATSRGSYRRACSVGDGTPHRSDRPPMAVTWGGAGRQSASPLPFPVPPWRGHARPFGAATPGRKPGKAPGRNTAGRPRVVRGP
jgi:hypothetical protein